MRRHLQESPHAYPIGDTADDAAAEGDEQPESDAYEVEISSYNTKRMGSGLASMPAKASGGAGGAVGPMASSLPKHLSLPRGHTSPYGTPNDRGSAIMRSGIPPLSPSGGKSSGVNSRSLSPANLKQQQQLGLPDRCTSGSSNVSSIRTTSQVGGAAGKKTNKKQQGKQNSNSVISFFNSRHVPDADKKAATSGRVANGGQSNVAIATTVEDGEGGVFRQETRPMDHLEATGHLQHAVLSIAQLIFFANAAEDEDQEVLRTVRSMNRLRRYPNAIDFFGGALDDGDEDDHGEDSDSDNSDGDTGSEKNALNAWGSAEDFPDGDIDDDDDDGTASILSSSRGESHGRSRRHGWRRRYGMRKLHELSARAARTIKTGLWMLLPFVPTVALFGVFSLPAATALSGWSTLLLVVACFAVVVMFSVKRLCAMCIQRIAWPLSPMEIDETGQLAAEQQRRASSVQPSSPPSATPGLAPVIHSYIFVTKSLIDLADAAAGIPFRIFTALLVVLYNIAAAVLALSIGLPLVGGGYNSARILAGLPSDAVLSSGKNNATDAISIEGCRFDIRAHIVPTSGLILFFLAIASPTPLRRLQYWSTHAFRMLTLALVVMMCLWTAAVPFLASSAQAAVLSSSSGNISASLPFFNFEKEWFPIDIERGTGTRVNGFQIPGDADDGASVVTFVTRRFGVSLAMLMWMFVGAVYAVRCSGHHMFGAELLRAQYKQLHEIKKRIQDALAATSNLPSASRQSPHLPTHRDEQEAGGSPAEAANSRKRLLLAAGETRNMETPTTTFFSRYASICIVLLVISLVGTCAICSSKYALDAHVFQGPLALLWTAKLDHSDPSFAAAGYRCTLGIQDGLHVRSLRVSAILCFLLGGLLMLWVPFFISEASRRIVFHRRSSTTAEDDDAAAKRFLLNKKRRAEEEARAVENSDILLSNSSVTSSSVDQSSSATKVRINAQRAMKKWNVGRVWRTVKSSGRSLISCCSYWGGLWRCCDRTSRRGVAPADDVATEFDGTKVSVLDIFERLRKRGANRRRSILLAFIAEFLLIRVVLLLLCVFCAVVTLSGERVRCISFWSFWKLAPYNSIANGSIETIVFKSCNEALTPLTDELFVRITLTMAITGGMILAPLILLVPMVVLLRDEWMKRANALEQLKFAQLAKSLRFWRSPKLSAGVGGETPPAREYSSTGFMASHNTVSMSRFGGRRPSAATSLSQHEQRLLSGSESQQEGGGGFSGNYGSLLGDPSSQNRADSSSASSARRSIVAILILVLFTGVSCLLLLASFAGGIRATTTFLGLSRHHIISD